MEAILLEAAKQAPALVILLVLCIAFVRSGAMMVKSFLSQLSETRSDYLSQSNVARGEYLKAIERFHSDNMEARALNRVTLADNTTAMDKQSIAMNNLAVEVHELRSMLGPILRKMSE